LGSAATSFRVESEGKDLTDFDFSELDEEENEWRALIQKEKDAHAKTKVASLSARDSSRSLNLRRE
jgi:hypothetical protein